MSRIFPNIEESIRSMDILKLGQLLLDTVTIGMVVVGFTFFMYGVCGIIFYTLVMRRHISPGGHFSKWDARFDAKLGLFHPELLDPKGLAARKKWLSCSNFLIAGIALIFSASALSGIVRASQG